jgi:hypothetical protein
MNGSPAEPQLEPSNFAMTTIEPSHALPVRAIGRVFWIGAATLAIALTLVATLVVAGITAYLGIGRDAEALRDSLMESAPGDWQRKVEFHVGAFTLNLARAPLAFVKIDPDLRAILRVVRSTEIGVYQLRDASKRLDHTAMLAAADRMMATRGLERTVGVLDRDELVAVYLSARLSSPRNVKACIVVVEDGQLVVASVRSNLEPLLEVVQRHVRWRQQEYRAPL